MSRAFGVLNVNGSVALRASVLVDPKGVVRHASCNDLGIGRSVDEALRILQAVKFVDANGGKAVCPVNWKPGSATIDPSNSSKYFSQSK